MSVNWTYGKTIDDYPTGLWDDFDGTVVAMEYGEGDYGAQMFVRVLPELYEYEARGETPPAEGDDENTAWDWWGMGNKSFVFSDDGYRVIEGAMPNRNSNVAKGIVKLLEATEGQGWDASPDLTAINEGRLKLTCHWKRETNSYEIEGEKRESVRLFPSGKTVGKAIAVDATSTAQSGSGGSSGGGRRRRRAAQTEQAETTDNTAEEQAEEVEEAPAQTSRRRRASTGGGRSSGGGRRSRRRNSQAQSEEAPAITQEQAVEALTALIDAEGDDGVPTNRLAHHIADSDLSAEMKTEIAKRSVRKAAVEAGKIEEEDGILYGM